MPIKPTRPTLVAKYREQYLAGTLKPAPAEAIAAAILERGGMTVCQRCRNLYAGRKCPCWNRKGE